MINRGPSIHEILAIFLRESRSTLFNTNCSCKSKGVTPSTSLTNTKNHNNNDVVSWHFFFLGGSTWFDSIVIFITPIISTLTVLFLVQKRKSNLLHNGKGLKKRCQISIKRSAFLLILRRNQLSDRKFDTGNYREYY